MDLQLREINVEDTANIVKWRNTESVKQNLFTQDDLTPEQHLWWLENRVKNGKCAQYIIVVEEDGVQKDIGTIFIKNIDRDSLDGEFGIQIGEESARNKGYGTEATRQILFKAFNELGLNRVYLLVMNNNISAIKAYLKSGFRRNTILKDHYSRNGKLFDILLMEILKSDWVGITAKNDN